MKILDRYVLSEMILPFLTGTLAVIVMLVGNTLYALLDVILGSHIPLIVVARLIVFNIPGLIVLTLPVGVALASALSVNRLARDSEITAIRMTGTPLFRIFLPIFVVGLTASIMSLWMGERIVPAAQLAFARTQSAMFGYAMSASPILVSDKVFSYQNYEFFVKEASRAPSANGSALLVSGVTIWQNPVDPYGFPKIITATKGVYDKGKWNLSDVVVHSLDDRGFTTTEIAGQTLSLDLRTPLPLDLGQTGSGVAGLISNLNMGQLKAQIDTLTRTGQDSTELEVNYYFEMALPFLCLAFAICAPPLAMRFARTGSFMGVFLSIVMVWVAWNTLLLTKALGLSHVLSPFLAAWAPDLLIGGAGLYLLWRME